MNTYSVKLEKRKTDGLRAEWQLGGVEKLLVARLD
jgi:hypothetical protein